MEGENFRVMYRGIPVSGIPIRGRAQTAVGPKGKPPQSRFACQLPQRGSRGCFAPFLPPAFMRGEGHAVAGGVPRSGGDNLLSHGFAVPAPPKGKPRALRAVLAPRIYEGGGPRSGGGSLPRGGESRLSHGFACQLSQRVSQGGCAPFLPPQRGSQGRCAPFLPPAFMRGEGRAAAGGVSPRRRGRPSQSRLRRASSPKGRAKGAAHRSCPPHL